MSYRAGHHSTSDDSSRYRAAEEMRAWRARDPVTRFQRWLVTQGWWTDEQDSAARAEARRWVWGGAVGRRGAGPQAFVGEAAFAA